MIVPRGPVVERGELRRPWRQALEREARRRGLPDVPRDAPEAALQRQWSRWFAALSGGALPRGPLYDATGDVTRDWRTWLEAV